MLSAKMPVYDYFVSGAKDGFGIVVGIASTIIGCMAAVASVCSIDRKTVATF